MERRAAISRIATGALDTAGGEPAGARASGFPPLWDLTGQQVTFREYRYPKSER